MNLNLFNCLRPPGYGNIILKRQKLRKTKHTRFAPWRSLGLRHTAIEAWSAASGML
jgi:hypothetical protein